ncbi:MAG: acetyl-CoA carboxylase biotin carboxyl carrier protein [Ruminococcus sp.]|nr:acetyl-CoA carboxylase biotin carboxyl carrier protein [Ruminococcus sp.]
MSKLGFDFTFENIERLADIVNDKELSEIAIEDDNGVKVTIKGKKLPPPPMPPMGMPPMQGMMPPPAQAAQTAQAAPAAAASGNAAKAPIVGTFYAAPSPDSAPFVSVGDTVKKGDVIYIIESMKVMSEIQSDFDGVVKEILVNNGDSVEFDQPIMIIG